MLPVQFMAAMVVTQVKRLALGNGMVTGGILTPTVFFPQSSFRTKTDGVAEKAGGSTEMALVYNAIGGGSWHTGSPIANAGDFEVFFDSLTNSATGEAGTWLGSTRDVWLSLDIQHTWTWQKDTTVIGTAEHIILIAMRRKAVTTDTTGFKTWTFNSIVIV